MNENISNTISGQIELIGQPIKNSFMLHCVSGSEDGRDVLYFSVTGEPSTFVVYDVNERCVLRSFQHGCDKNEFLGTKACWTHAKDPYGNIYMAPFGSKSGYLFKYDINLKKLKTVGAVLGETALYHLSCDEDGNVYGGTYPNGKIFKYVANEDKFIDYGTIIEDNNYIISCVYHDGNVYGGTRGSNPKFFKFNLETKEREMINPPSSIKDKMNAFYYLTKVNHLLFPVIKMENETYYVTCYDTNKKKWMDICEKGLGGQHVSPQLHDSVYFTAENGWLKEINLKTFQVINTGILYYQFHEGDDGFDYANGLMGGGFVKLKDQENYPGFTYLTVNYDKNKIAYVNLEKKSVEFYSSDDFIENDIQIKAIGNTPNGEIIFGGYMGNKVCLYDPDNPGYQYFTCRQTEGITTCNDKVYFGVYTRASIWEYDPGLPYIEFENPKPIFIIGEHQDRPFALCDAGGKLAIGTIPNYGSVGGALTIYDPNTKEKKVFKNIIKNQSITSVCYKDGLLYCSTGIWGGLGCSPVEKEAKVFIFDMETEKVIAENTLKFDFSHEPLMYIGGLAFDPQGVLWGISSGVVFTLDSKTLEVTNTINVSGINWKMNTPNWKPSSLIFADDYLYCNQNGYLTKMNTKTKEVEAYPQKAFMMTMGKDHNIYFCDSGNLYKFNINYSKKNR